MDFATVISEFFEKLAAFFTAILVALGIVTSTEEPEKPTLTQTAVYTINAQADTCYTVEGGCSDGRYVYAALINSAMEKEDTTSEAESEEEEEEDKGIPCHIVKIDSTTWTQVAVSETLYIDHANDITYNPDTNKLLIANNIPNYSTITIVNPDTLEVEDSKKLVTEDTETKIYSITYVGEKDCYYCGKSNEYNYVVIDKDFNVVSTLTGIDPRTESLKYTRQSIGADDNYFYSLFYNPNSVYRYDLDGKAAGSFTLTDMKEEAEFLFFINGTLYIGTNTQGDKTTGGIIYKIENEEYL